MRIKKYNKKITKRYKHNKNSKKIQKTIKKYKKIQKTFRKNKYGGVGPIKANPELNEVTTQMEMLISNPDERQARMLSVVCNANTRGSCVDFGSYREQIKIFFENYSLNTPYAKSVTQITSGTNAIILKVNYERLGYKSYSLIKWKKYARNDNLMYEYYVGVNFINKFVPIFPCFVETYKPLYFYDKEKKGIKFREVDDVSSIVNPISTFANNACKLGKENKVAIMLQYYDKLTALTNIFTPNNKYDSAGMLFQVYFVLSSLSNEFTHYDLYTNNVFAYKPYEGERYIVMTYHFNDGTTITFPTEYIIKILDYGRSYFNNTRTGISSQDLYEKFCANHPTGNKDSNITDCDDKCSEEAAGIVLGEYKEEEGSFYYISPNKRNKSHDLRLIKNQINFNRTIINLDPLCKVVYRSNFGTKEIEESTYDENNHVVRNVEDMLKLLKLNINKWIDTKFIGWKTQVLSDEDEFNKYASPIWNKMGDIHVYENRKPYEFIPSVYN